MGIIMSSIMYKVKCVILGSPEDIKTRLLRNISTSHFQRCYKAIVGVDIGIIQLIVNNIPVMLSLWDCLCQKRTNFFRTGFYKGSDGAIFCYNSNTIDSIKFYINEFKKSCEKKLPLLYIYIKQNENDLIKLPKNEKNGKKFQHLDEALNWLAQIMIEPDPESESAYIELLADVLPEIIIPPDVSSEVSHPDILTPILESMGFKVSEQKVVNILTDKALFSINLLDTNVNVYPLICDICKRDCKREKNICIVLNTRGWTTISDLSQKDLLVLSKIFSLANLPYKDLPIGIKNQIKNVLFCPKFRKK